MSDVKTITASLEGMRVVVTEKKCELQEYDFRENRWNQKDEASWPLSGSVAEEWLTGWNRVDRFAAMNLLTEPLQFPEDERRFVSAP